MIPMRAFWSDPEGLTIEDVAVLAALGLYVFVGVKIALGGDISGNQVDFFTVLGYPIIAAIARRAIERIGWPALGRRQVRSSRPQYPAYGYSDATEYPTVDEYAPTSEGSEEAAGTASKPTI